MFKKDGYYWVDGMEEYYYRYVRHMKDAEVILPHVRDRETVVQAGGHVGLWPLYLASVFREVITFEPEVENFEVLLRNIEGVRNVTAYNALIGSDVGDVGMKVSPKNTGGHHVDPEGSGYTITTLDTLGLESCDAIVLDVEGQELNSLIGAEETIREFRPVLMMEDKSHVKKGGCTTEELHEYLESIGYTAHSRKSKDTVFIPC